LSFVVVAGIPIPVAVGGAQKKAPEKSGSDSRAFAGDLRSTTRWTKRGWQFTSKLLLEADAAAVETAIAAGFMICSGDALGGSVTCLVTAGDAPITKVSSHAGGFRRALVLTLREV
jgi:hypothetical protein